MPDPAGAAAVDITNPQTWNRYAYAINNRLNAIDPEGLYVAVPCFDVDNPGNCSWGLGGGAPCSNCGANTSWQEFNQAAQVTFGENYFLIPGNFGFGTNYDAQLGQYLKSAYKDATLGPNGWIIAFSVGFLVSCSSTADAGCLTGYDHILFQFTDPSMEKHNLSFNTSFTNLVAAFGRIGIIPSSLDNNPYYRLHPFSMRANVPYCSAHVTLDTASDLPAGQPTTGSIHIDLYNPTYPLLAKVTHGAVDVLPWVARRAGIHRPSIAFRLAGHPCRLSGTKRQMAADKRKQKRPRGAA